MGLDVLTTPNGKASQAPALNPDGSFPGGADSGTYTNGMIIGGKNSPFGQAVQRTPHSGFGPRIGFAWDPRSNGRNSIRGGYGIFFDSLAVNSVEQFASENPPIVQSRNIPNPDFANPSSGQPLVNPFPRTVGGPSPNNWNLPYSQMYNLDFQQQSLQFRAEAFNGLNHTNFNTFQSTRLGSSLFGKIGSARDPPIMQLALKLIF